MDIPLVLLPPQVSRIWSREWKKKREREREARWKSPSPLERYERDRGVYLCFLSLLLSSSFTTGIDAGFFPPSSSSLFSLHFSPSRERGKRRQTSKRAFLLTGCLTTVKMSANSSSLLSFLFEWLQLIAISNKFSYVIPLLKFTMCS